MNDDYHPTNQTRSNNVFTALITPPQPTGKIYTDQTGRFPQQSSRGNNYIMILYDYDSNAILAEPIKNRSQTELLRAYTKLHTLLCSRGFQPQIQLLDNEAPHELKQFLTQQQIDYQLVPPHVHRRNAAKRAIRTFKEHFVAGLCSTDKNFPLHLWDRLIPQAIITLNLLRSSRLHPQLSAHAHLHGPFDYNKTPLAPPGTRVIIHTKTSQRKSWAPHGEEGWYIGPALEHYRCYQIYVPKTRSERITDTVEFFPTKYTVPTITANDIITRAARNIVTALHDTPVIQLHPQRQKALIELADIMTKYAKTIPPVNNPNVPHKPQHLPTETNTKAPRVPEKASILPPHRYPTRYKASVPTPHPDPYNYAQTVYEPNLAFPQQPAADIRHIFNTPTHVHQHLANAVTHPVHGHVMEYKELIKDPHTKEVWLKSSANEFGRLAQGVGGRIKGTNTIKFINHKKVPRGRTVTYARFVCELRPMKAEVERTRITVGGNLINYPGRVSTNTADITTAKCLWNSTISKKKAKFMCADVKNFYLNTPMDRPEYMKIPIELIPPEIILEYNLQDLVHDGYVYIEINKGMYGLPQAGLLANKLLGKRLAKYGYYQSRHTPGLWKHTWRPIQFVLVVDDFGVEYIGRDHAEHLISALRTHYEAVSTDWEGSLYCGITLKWDYQNRTVQLSMPNYVQKALTKFQHPHPPKPQYAPHKHNIPQYGVTIQLTEPPDTTQPLNKKKKLASNKSSAPSCIMREPSIPPC